MYLQVHGTHHTLRGAEMFLDRAPACAQAQRVGLWVVSDPTDEHFFLVTEKVRRQLMDYGYQAVGSGGDDHQERLTL